MIPENIPKDRTPCSYCRNASKYHRDKPPNAAAEQLERVKYRKYLRKRSSCKLNTGRFDVNIYKNARKTVAKHASITASVLICQK